MRAEKIRPWGMSSDSTESAGVHISTKAYIDPSNSAWMTPSEQTRQSEKIVEVADEKLSTRDADEFP